MVIKRTPAGSSHIRKLSAREPARASEKPHFVPTKEQIGFAELEGGNALNALIVNWKVLIKAGLPLPQMQFVINNALKTEAQRREVQPELFPSFVEGVKSRARKRLEKDTRLSPEIKEHLRAIVSI